MAHNLFKYSLYQGAGGVLNTADDSFATNSNVELTWHPQGLEQTTNQAVIGPVTTPTAAGYEVLRRLNVLEVFNGTKFLNITLPPAPAPTGSTTGSGGGTGVVAGPPQVSATLSDTQINLINQSYAALQESVYSALVVQTRLRSYLDSIELVVDNTGVHFNAAPMAAALDARKTSDARNGLIDLIDLNRYAQPTLQAVGFAGVATLRSWVDALPTTSPLRSELPALGVMLASATGGTDTADVFFRRCR